MKSTNDVLERIWERTPADYKAVLEDGVRCILVMRSKGTTLVPLEALEDDEIRMRMPRK